MHAHPELRGKPTKPTLPQSAVGRGWGGVRRAGLLPVWKGQAVSIHQVTATSSKYTPTVGTRGHHRLQEQLPSQAAPQAGPWATPRYTWAQAGRGRQARPHRRSHSRLAELYRLWGSWHTQGHHCITKRSPPFLRTAPIPAPHCWWEMSPSRTPVSPQDQPVLRRVGWPQGPAHPSALHFPIKGRDAQVELPTAAPSKSPGFSTPLTAM